MFVHQRPQNGIKIYGWINSDGSGNNHEKSSQTEDNGGASVMARLKFEKRLIATLLFMTDYVAAMPKSVSECSRNHYTSRIIPRSAGYPGESLWSFRSNDIVGLGSRLPSGQ
jgi:hypothetical protein